MDALKKWAAIPSGIRSGAYGGLLGRDVGGIGRTGSFNGPQNSSLKREFAEILSASRKIRRSPRNPSPSTAQSDSSATGAVG
jgi:hypothetical protein